MADQNCKVKMKIAGSNQPWKSEDNSYNIVSNKSVENGDDMLSPGYEA